MGVSSKLKTAQGMGAAVVFVIVLASLMTWLTYNYLLVPLHLEYLYTLSFILVIAALVQFVELALKKLNPVLYKSLGICMGAFRAIQARAAKMKGLGATPAEARPAGCGACIMAKFCSKTEADEECGVK